LLSAASACAGASVTARFDPEEIVYGSTAQLVVTVQARSRGTAAPEVAADGLDLHRVGAVHRIGPDGEVVSTFTYLATPSRMGTLTLDPGTIAVEGDLLPLPSASLSVRRVPAKASAASDMPQLVERIRLAVLHVPRQVYVGEVVPVELALMVPDGLRFRIPKNYPLKVGDQFAQGSPADPLVGAMVREKAGPSPEQLRWRTLVTAQREGMLTLAFAVGLSVELAQSNLVEGGVGQGWKDIFQATPEWTPFTALSGQHTVEAIPLPDANRPAGFGGAIGQFTLLAPEIRRAEGAGKDDPVEIIFPVQGMGNLPAVAPPNLAIDGNWRLGRARKTVHLEDKLGHRATVSFHYTLIPTREAAIPPPFQLSYFDPATGHYEVLQHQFSQPIGSGR
jgi:hypothetical protein